MAKTTTRSRTSTARHPHQEKPRPLQGLSDAPGTVADTSAAGKDPAKDAEQRAKDDEAARQKAAHTTVHATPPSPNPPVQPEMVPAKQVHAQTVGGAPAVDPDDIVKHPRNRAKPIRVQATALGYYDDVLRRVDDVFDIYREQDFSKKWMARVPSSTPTHVTGSNAALRKGPAANEGKDAEDNPIGAD